MFFRDGMWVPDFQPGLGLQSLVTCLSSNNPFPYHSRLKFKTKVLKKNKLKITQILEWKRQKFSISEWRVTHWKDIRLWPKTSYLCIFMKYVADYLSRLPLSRSCSVAIWIEFQLLQSPGEAEKFGEVHSTCHMTEWQWQWPHTLQKFGKENTRIKFSHSLEI